MLSKINKWLGQEKIEEHDLSQGEIPNHVAIIMDGNGRWARKRGLPRIAGHHAGMKAVKEVTLAADEIGVKILTLYAFSTENWKRPKDEVDYLMRLPEEFLKIELQDLIKNNVQVRMMGDQDQLPSHTLSAVKTAIEATKQNTGLILNFALNYGSRKELTDTVKEIGLKIANGEITPNEIDEELISKSLPSGYFGDPDLLIRTSGEIRLSNFMLWQLAYTELWFCDLYWPDFGKEHLMDAIKDFQKRVRRYGAVK
jgi:undecaprenyl diphosphate synthase